MDDYFTKSYEVLKFRNNRLAEKNTELYEKNRILRKELQQLKSAIILETTRYNKEILSFLNN